MQPQQPNNNPYDFITAPTVQTKKPLFGGAGKKGLLLTVVGGLTVLTLLLVVVASLFGGQSNEDIYFKAIQQQAEITRVANIGVTSSRGNEARNLAITARQTMQSQQPELYKLATASGIEKIDEKKIALGKNTKTDEQLTSANQINQFDEKFIELMISQLKEYQATLTELHEASNSQKTKDTLDTMFTQIQTMVRSQTPTLGSASDTPATN
jgi:hypothetical protein